MSTNFDFRNIEFEQSTSSIIQVFDKAKKDTVLAKINKVSQLSPHAMNISSSWKL